MPEPRQPRNPNWEEVLLRIEEARANRERNRLEARARENSRREREAQEAADREVGGQVHYWIMPEYVQIPHGAPQDQVQAMPAPIAAPEPEIEEDKDVKVVNEFLIGCDPELIGIKDGKHANASAFGIPQRGPVGWDHGGDVIELRPRPAKTAFTLSLHLKDLVKTLTGGDKFRAGAYFKGEPDVLGRPKEMTLGGHVHIDVPFELVDYGQRQRVAALDEVTHRLEELDVLTKAEMPLRRTRGKAVFAGIAGTPYGAFGDVKSADGANRLEYRTMPSWLYSPVTTFLALTSAKLAAAHPEETLRHFMFQPASKAKLRGFFELFSDKDVDAKRAVEMIFEANRSIVRDPDVDVVKTWEKEWKQIAA